MTLFEVSAANGEPSTTYATKRDAIAAARTLATDSSVVVTVDQITLGPLTKALVVRLVNVEGGYVDSRRTVYTTGGAK